MSYGDFCLFCEHCNLDRENEKGEKRCTRFSMWVDAYNVCESYKEKDECKEILIMREFFGGGNNGT